MGVFYHEESPNHPKRCKYIAATLKEVFSHCQTFEGRLSTASLEEEWPMSDFDEEQEVVVSEVRSRAMEKQKHKQPGLLRDSFCWVYSPATKELYVTHEAMEPQEREDGGDRAQGQGQGHEEREEFLSAKSCFSMSCCSSSSGVTVSGEAFYSAKTSLLVSRCSSLKLNREVDLSKYWRRSIIEEFCRYEGWPFGLCRRAVLLPPLPKSPSESWLSRKIQRSRSSKHN